MAEETISNSKEPERKLTRRSFLKGAVVGGAAIAAGALVKREADSLSKEGIETREGIFIPLYELDHSLGIKKESVPSDVDTFFMEGVGSLKVGPESLLSNLGDPISNTNVREHIIAPDLLIKLAKQNAEVMVGDVELPETFFRDRYRIEASKNVVGLMAIGYSIVDKLADKLKGVDVRSPKGVSRRSFLRKAALAGGLWAASPLISHDIILGQALKLRPDNTAARRIIARLAGMEANLHPEDIVSFFRSLVMAEKLLVAADEFKQRVGRKPKIAFDVGAAHGNIEDFLQVGQDVCRALILTYPNSLLQETIKLNDGIENFSRIDFYRLPFDLSSELPIDLLRQKVAKESKKRSFVDEKLAAGLHKKLKM